METLLSKRRAAAMRGIPDRMGDTTQSHVEWSAVEEGFRLLERDLEKLQVRFATTSQYVRSHDHNSNLWKSTRSVSAKF